MKGQELRHSVGGQTDEGWSIESSMWSLEDGVVTSEYFTDGCDCDGRSSDPSIEPIAVLPGVWFNTDQSEVLGVLLDRGLVGTVYAGFIRFMPFVYTVGPDGDTCECAFDLSEADERAIVSAVAGV